MNSPKSSHTNLKSAWRRFLVLPGHWLKTYWRKGWWQKLLTIGFTTALVCLILMFSISRWYAWTQRNTPVIQGVTFIPSYAQYLGVDPQETMDALLRDVGVKHLRLVSYWDQIEPTKGTYDFSSLDWQFDKANKANASISLAIGLRQPRWPECHAPSWIDTNQPASQWQPELQQFMTAVIDRYKNNPALDSYQLENEYFLSAFGECHNFDRQRLVDEYQLVKRLDPKHQVAISRSNNYAGLPLGDPRPDKFGISIYRRVWDTSLHTNGYLQYPFPAWYYGFLAGAQKLTTGRDSFIHEFQAEAWPPSGKSITDISLDEQNKSFNAKRFQRYFGFAKATGIHETYYWGGEYWYYRKVKLNDNSVWQVAQQEFQARQN